MILGCIGDDFTGSSDLANTLAKAGMRTVQYSGVPDGDADGEVEAGVVALKSRTVPAAEAVTQSLAALRWLQRQGCRQFFFKYCSTFDSTERGNIGPVAESLAQALAAETVIFCPAFPTAGRTVVQGHLFVGDRLLSESGMENHPLTPMRDADLRRVLARQSQGRVGHVAIAAVLGGAAAIRAALQRQQETGNVLIVVDAIRDDDLYAIGAAARDMVLITGGSGVAMGLPQNFAAAGLLAGEARHWTGSAGPAAALAGSVSEATRRQVERHRADGHPLRQVTADEALDNSALPEELAGWLVSQPGVPLVYSSADPQVVADVQRRRGTEAAAGALERVLAKTAQLAVTRGVRRLICAGGETSGAIVSALNVGALEIGPEIDPGVPALLAAGRDLVLTLKSGNFGSDDFFAKAARRLAGDS